MREIPIKDILINLSHTLPISEMAIINIINRLEYAQELPTNLAIQSSRHPLRVIKAILPDLDILKPEDLAIICGLENIARYPYLQSVINCEGNWNGETTPSIIRAILYSLQIDNKEPNKILDLYKVNKLEKEHLEFLLEMKEEHETNKLTDILNIIETNKGITKYYKIGKYLKTKNIKKIYNWHKNAKEIINTIIKYMPKEKR